MRALSALVMGWLASRAGTKHDGGRKGKKGSGLAKLASMKMAVMVVIAISFPVEKLRL